ncbi:MAG TPA: hypothetical protein PLA41_02130 [Candidatus Pacearchaeota archaeon]|nr:hypothetical protein [Candidatus Parcubacteria bacterium]HNZ84060.1 hypothetical protein [Candidatus Pacearchaeota archaeon]HOU45925.1 hypothetical protein [Candidatus Pacearchaeota archaeon]HPM08218.1 hypothetical protein [Candidatus Pacearchaeota archaeon]HQI74462.1 hypothetical protein [Candidatus Pacearchaeota archaeon]
MQCNYLEVQRFLEHSNVDPFFWVLLEILGMIAMTAFFVTLAYFFVTGYLKYKIAKKMNIKEPWLAWIPGLDSFAIAQMAGLKWYYGFIFFLGFSMRPSFSSIYFAIVVFFWWKIAEKLKKPNWYAILMGIPLINIFMLWKMSSEEKNEEKK